MGSKGFCQVFRVWGFVLEAESFLRASKNPFVKEYAQSHLGIRIIVYGIFRN